MNAIKLEAFEAKRLDRFPQDFRLETSFQQVLKVKPLGPSSVKIVVVRIGVCSPLLSVKLGSEENDSQQTASSTQVIGWRQGQVVPDRTWRAFYQNSPECQIQEKSGAHQHKDYAIRDERPPNAFEATASSPDDDDDMAEHVGDNRSTFSADPVDEFDPDDRSGPRRKRGQ